MNPRCASTREIAEKINEILAALRAAGLMEESQASQTENPEEGERPHPCDKDED